MMNDFGYIGGEFWERPEIKGFKFYWNVAVILRHPLLHNGALSLIADHFNIPNYTLETVEDLADFMVINGYCDWSLKNVSKNVWILKYGERND